jgi:hypothetical protein
VGIKLEVTLILFPGFFCGFQLLFGVFIFALGVIVVMTVVVRQGQTFGGFLECFGFET